MYCLINLQYKKASVFHIFRYQESVVVPEVCKPDKEVSPIFSRSIMPLSGPAIFADSVFSHSVNHKYFFLPWAEFQFLQTTVEHGGRNRMSGH